MCVCSSLYMLVTLPYIWPQIYWFPRLSKPLWRVAAAQVGARDTCLLGPLQLWPMINHTMTASSTKTANLIMKAINNLFVGLYRSSPGSTTRELSSCREHPILGSKVIDYRREPSEAEIYIYSHSKMLIINALHKELWSLQLYSPF